ncbi:hypothetical protein T440DRAFT_66007 [Plenodomus tracheiphilus IPT5]|uniref:Uncharacterized protein n=1 Tax=Plenodomus tracheiphilus IPT5 TaxID=1408161 RepID=A0A6A7B7S8_9PLEO|nr:hypothetical protein T440DRAFT_66007 [Plenodomus tracheiphilus IPT5]
MPVPKNRWSPRWAACPWPSSSTSRRTSTPSANATLNRGLSSAGWTLRNRTTLLGRRRMRLRSTPTPGTCTTATRPRRLSPSLESQVGTAVVVGLVTSLTYRSIRHPRRPLPCIGVCSYRTQHPLHSRALQCVGPGNNNSHTLCFSPQLNLCSSHTLKSRNTCMPSLAHPTSSSSNATRSSRRGNSRSGNSVTRGGRSAGPTWRSLLATSGSQTTSLWTHVSWPEHPSSPPYPISALQTAPSC